tara:strand:- start:604 stop:1260 length:657 start_codon:yes stop_codon:yes gene_type:complete
MAVSYNPRIVTDGLVLCLDAGNTKSYPGSGTTWTDLSGNGNHATINNYGDSPSFISNFGGAFNFSPGQRFYIDISQLNNTNPYTVIWFGVDGSGDQYSGISRDTSWRSGNHLIGWRTGAIYTDSGRDTNTNSTGDEFMICHTNNTSTKSVSQYLNGVYYGNFSYTSWSARERWSFGSRGDGNGHQYTGKISAIQMYSRELTAAEVAQNFNALRERFGI